MTNYDRSTYLVIQKMMHMFLKSELSWTIGRVVCGISTRTNQNA